jgi:hypothetical protein
MTIWTKIKDAAAAVVADGLITAIWPKLKIAVAIQLLLALLNALAYVYVQRGDRDQARRESAAARQESAAMAQDLAAQSRALIDRQAAMDRLANEYAALAATLEEVYRDDPEANAWADDPLPAAVVERLRQ